ncbi:MAG: hypothetical protein HY454_03265 [Parcubacteria group bacterium]|nr:hypothetical protein [Parcubacteria group bacterium]
MRRILQWLLRWASVAVLTRYKPKIVAITGSVGKSSAKEAIALVLSQVYPGEVRKSAKNLNNEIGVPLTIIGGVDARHNVFLWLLNFLRAIGLIVLPGRKYPKILVLETAADRPGDIGYLTSFVKPDVAVITAIGEMPVHLEFFPERDEYVSEKTQLLKSLKPGGTAVLNYDDLTVRELRNRIPTGRERIYYGFQTGAEVRLVNFKFGIPASSSELDKAGIDFKVDYGGETVAFRLPRTLGLPPLYAALAAVAVGLKFGLKLADTAAALEKYQPLPGRLELLVGVKETIIIDDSYNASPLATEAALDILERFGSTSLTTGGSRRKIAVLGSMRELGVNTESAHRLVGKKAALVADVVVLVGDEMVFAKEDAAKFGRKLGESLFWFETADEAKLKVQEILRPGDVILIKGSRSVSMEKVVEEIVNRV